MSLSGLLLRGTEHIMPFKCLTLLSGKIAEAKLGFLSQFLIKNFIKSFKINLDECEQQNLSSYSCFNDFFTRRLKEDARPISNSCLACSPVDGTVAELGDISFGRLIQAKGIDYSLREVIGGDQKDAAAFEAGLFATIYLSPANYHRIHMPMDANLKKTIYVPGTLYPVGDRNIQNMSNLYSSNERLVCLFESELGSFCLIMVGAALVGSISTVWGGVVKRSSEVKVDDFDPGQYSFKRGDEIGMFKYGSTVICMWPENIGRLPETLSAGEKIQMGSSLLL